MFEVILTLMLMFVALSAATGAKERGLMAGVAVRAVVALEALFAGPVCWVSMNPARSLAPAIVSGTPEHLWMYLVAPPLGACLAVLACARIHDGACCGCERGEQAVSEATPRKRVLFVCVENSNRSRMAEAFARMHGEAASRPTQPAVARRLHPGGDSLNPRAEWFRGPR